MYDDNGVPYEFPGCFDALDDISSAAATSTAAAAPSSPTATGDAWESDPGACAAAIH